MKTVLKWTGWTLGTLVLLLSLAYAVLYLRSEAMMRKVWTVEVEPQTIVPDSAAVAHAAHLAESIYGCAACHGENFSGRVMLDGPPGRFVSSNLTPAGVGATYTDADWDRAIRHGIRPDGTPLIIMGANRFHNISDADFAALVAFLKALPPVESDLPDEMLRPLGRILIGTGTFVPAVERIDHDVPSPPRVAPAPTATYGAYLTELSCVECHGSDLRGGAHPDPAGPPAPDLAAAGAWPLDVFIHSMRTGTRPGGTALNAEWMPWPEFALLNDDELTALHAYLQTLTTPTASAQD